jgi:prepilin peptidase CpaA
MPSATLHLFLLTVVLAAAVYSDVLARRIPNALVLAGLGAGTVVGLMQSAGWWGPVPAAAGSLGASLAGGAAGLAAGVAFFALGALGAGDGKLLAVVGTFLGPLGLFVAVLYAGVAGGLLALGDAVRRGTLLPVLLRTRDLAVFVLTLGRHGERPTAGSPSMTSIPYGVAIAVGALVAWFFPGLPGGAA